MLQHEGQKGGQHPPTPSCTWSPSSSATLSSVVSELLSAGVAILNASWANLKIKEEEWMFFWMASSTVRRRSMSPGYRKGQSVGLSYPQLTPEPHLLPALYGEQPQHGQPL